MTDVLIKNKKTRKKHEENGDSEKMEKRDRERWTDSQAERQKS